jgi:antitoxin component YwqK of YwqJK toxin-antitoxin module
MKSYVLVLFALLSLNACTDKSATTTKTESTREVPIQKAASTDDYSNYALSPVPGTGMQRAILFNEAGKIVEQGYLDENGLKTGEWLAFYTNTGLPYKLITYRAGVQNGLYIFFNEIGQVSLLATYADNLLDGYWIKYRFSRPEEEAVYKAGKMHGVHKQYFVREGWLQASTEYKDGTRDGYYRTYNAQGDVTLEYLYRNGEMVKGGMK